MPNASEAELCEATETFKRYIRIVIGIYERIERERVQNDSTNRIDALDSEYHASV